MAGEKKSERLEIRLGHAEKRSFVDACEMQGDTPSGALRRFIAGYTRRTDGDLMGEANRRMIRRYGSAVILGVGLFAAGFLAVTLPNWTNAPPALTDTQLFELRDANGNGVLELAEHKLLPASEDQPNAVLRVLDLDGSGTLSLEEFQSEGRMVFSLNKDRDTVVSREGETAPMTFVEFQFTPEITRVRTYADARINAGALHRAVIWYDDGTHSRFDGDVSIEMGDDGSMSFTGNVATFPASMEFSDEAENKVRVSRNPSETP